MRHANPILLFAALLVLEACAPEPVFPDRVPDDFDVRFTYPPTRSTLFGRPNDENYVKENCCMPSCVYIEEGEEVVWTAPVYEKADMERLVDEWRLTEAPEPLKKYNPGKVCAVVPDREATKASGGPVPYKLMNFDSEEEARAMNGTVTHTGSCGACSSLRNLAVYIANPDLSGPVRDCALVGFFDREFSRLACIASLGFDLPCAQAWDANVQNTQGSCLQLCRGEQPSSNTEYDCTTRYLPDDDAELLNDCLLCDEVFSIDIFRTEAGRARRNSGLPSPICRDCKQVARIEHYYPRPDD